MGDKLFALSVKTIALSLIVLLISIGVFLAWAAYPSLTRFGWGFLTSSAWDPVKELFGALPVIYGTLVSSFLALLFALPLSLGAALFINELASKKWGNVVGFLIEMLAAIPSVVYGLWGIFVLAPWFRSSVQPLFKEYLGFLPLFSGPSYGVGMLTAAIVLTIMILPTITALSREVFRTVPSSLREAALALGATRWEMIRLAVVKSTKAGVFGAIILGLGRALGETMAVTMVIGNRAQISASLFAPSQTMASVIANEYAEATSDFHLAALAEIGLVLFGVTFVVNAMSRFLLWHVVRRNK